jgi:surface protein
MTGTFFKCTKIVTIPLLDTSKVTLLSQTFLKCSSLETIPLLDTSNVTTMYSCFKECVKLVSIPALNVSNVENFQNCFLGCTSLKSILMTGMKESFDISSSTRFEESDLVTILNNLATVTTTQTLTMGATNLAKLSDEQKKIATDKGWTLA